MAWYDLPYGTDSAHLSTECSSNGLCDRSTGKCRCFDGFDGESCNRNKCACSGHGECTSMADISYYDGLDGQHDGHGFSYSNWEKDSLSMCECYDGYIGPDCSLSNYKIFSIYNNIFYVKKCVHKETILILLTNNIVEFN